MTQAIQLAFSRERAYDGENIRLNSHEAIKQIAVVNVKKSNRLKESDDEDLKTYVKRDRKLLKKELEIINPDIIVYGYTFGMLKTVLEDELEADNTGIQCMDFGRIN